jgi:copper chaperone
MIQVLNYIVTGEEKIHCEGCETRIANALKRLEGVRDVRASAQDQGIAISINTDAVTPEQVEQRLAQLGYQIARA